MAALSAENLLGPEDPAPVDVYNAKGRSAFLLLGDHAGRRIPASLGDLGLSAADRVRHIAFDIGSAGLGRTLADLLDAPFIHQAYSRLVIDCNRDPAHADAIPAVSDGSRIPLNDHLGAKAHAARVAAIHAPYHDAIAAAIERRRDAGRDTILLSMHSFTPVLDGFDRPWDIGILHEGGRNDFALAMLAAMQGRDDLCVGDNQPYCMDDTDYTIPRHAFVHGLRYAEIEVRQDLIAHDAGQRHWAGIVHHAAVAALRELS